MIQHFMTVLCHQNQVLDADACHTRHIDARLHRKGHARFQNLIVG